jgi:hypothetical protein
MHISNDGKRVDILKLLNFKGGCPEPDEDELLVINYKKHVKRDCFSVCGDVRSDYIFAFTSARQVKKWFSVSGIMKLINWHGFEVAVKEIPDEKVVKGYTQCVVDIGAWFETDIEERWVPERRKFIPSP